MSAARLGRSDMERYALLLEDERQWSDHAARAAEIERLADAISAGLASAGVRSASDFAELSASGDEDARLRYDGFLMRVQRIQEMALKLPAECREMFGLADAERAFERMRTSRNDLSHSPYPLDPRSIYAEMDHGDVRAVGQGARPVREYVEDMLARAQRELSAFREERGL